MRSLFSLTLVTIFMVFSVVFGGEGTAIGPPVIDISALVSPPPAPTQAWMRELSSVLQQMDRAFVEHGVFVVTNHGLTESDIQSGFQAANDLFSLPMEEKEAVNINKLTNLNPSTTSTVNADGTIASTSSDGKDLVFGRGYLSFGSESGLATIFEPKEGYSYGYPLPLPDQDLEEGETAGSDGGKIVRRNLLNGPNFWPKSLSANSKTQLEAFYLHFVRVASHIAHYLIRFHNTMIMMEERSRASSGESVQEEPVTSQKKKIHVEIEGGEYISLMRLFHYFAKSSSTVKEYEEVHNSDSGSVKKEALGSSPHTDWGLLTVILQNEVTGLQYMHKGEWIDVPYIPGSLIINIGDYFALSSHGKYHSPIHRVLCPTTADRTSFVLFFYPDYDSKMMTVQKGDEEAASRDNADAQDKQEGFNTLTSLQSEDGKEHSFGDYIVKKWKDVFRANMKY